MSLPEKTVKSFLEENCFRCHGPEKQKGKMRLDTLSLQMKDGTIAQKWQDVLDVLNAGDMPPDFTLPLLDGGEITLSKLRRKPVVIEFGSIT